MSQAKTDVEELMDSMPHGSYTVGGDKKHIRIFTGNNIFIHHFDRKSGKRVEPYNGPRRNLLQRIIKWMKDTF